MTIQSIQVADLIADVRVRSGLRGNPLFSDDQIAELLTDAYAALRDKINARFAFWFAKDFSFTLTGGDGGNVIDLPTLVPDFLQVQYLNRNRPNGRIENVTELPTIVERNRFQGAYPFGGCGLHYFVDGDTLEVLSASQSAGDYKLRYTPIGEALALPVTRTFAIDPADDPLTDGEGSGFNFTNGNFSAEDVGGTFTVTFDAPNANFSGTYTISGIHSGSTTWVFVEGGVFPGGFTSPASGPDVSLTYHPAGTRSDLPIQLTPWALYLKNRASIDIRSSQKQETTDLERSQAQIEARIVTATKTRTQGVQRVPVRRRRYGGGYGYGGNF